MKPISSSSVWLAMRGDHDTHTDDISVADLRETQLTRAEGVSWSRSAEDGTAQAVEANIILISHPEGKRLGSRFRLGAGRALTVGRDPDAGISLPEVPSISRRHAMLRFNGSRVSLEDLGSTNGTYINGELIRERKILGSGDRFQVAAVHFKFLHELDVEHAYYEAISELVTKDGLTELFNKRKFDEEAEREASRALRYRRPLSLIAFDLDNFKQINDTYGHLCGDFVLKQIASILREVLRPEQFAARVGGDEFVILCPETELDGAVALAQRLRDRVAGLDYSYCDFKISVTCSFGVARLSTEMKHGVDVYAAADQALYASKRAGRNRVSVASKETTPP